MPPPHACGTGRIDRLILLFQPVREQIIGDPRDLRNIALGVPQAIAHPQKHVHPADRPSVDFADVGTDFAALGATFQPLPHARDRRFIMAAIARIIDELGLVDDAVDFLVLAHEAEEGFKPDALGADLVGRRLHARRDMVAQLLAHIADERLEDFVLRIEIGIETAERGAGAARDAADRRIVKSALAKLGRRVLLMDADLGLGNIDILLGLRPTKTLADVIAGRVHLRDILIEGPCGIRIVPAASGIKRMAEMQPTEHARIVQGFADLGDDFDVMIVDLEMPDMTGLEVIAAIRKMPRHRDLPAGSGQISGQDVHNGGLARTIRPQQAADAAVCHCKGNILYRQTVPVFFGKMRNFDHK